MPIMSFATRAQNRPRKVEDILLERTLIETNKPLLSTLFEFMSLQVTEAYFDNIRPAV